MLVHVAELAYQNGYVNSLKVAQSLDYKVIRGMLSQANSESLIFQAGLQDQVALHNLIVAARIQVIDVAKYPYTSLKSRAIPPL